MKIRIKEKQLKQLNESYLIEDDGSIATEQKPEAFDEFTADAKYQYIMQRKKEALPVSIILPNIFDLPVKLPNPPEDISNIMSSYQVNKARKTKNIGGVMQDPIQTYNNADACCADAFGNFAGITFEQDEKQRKINKSYISKSGDSNESYNYNGFPVLNESPAAAGFAVGQAVGGVAGGIISAGAGAAVGLAAGVAAEAGLICAGAYALGYVGEQIFGNVEGGGATNDKVTAHLNDQRQNMLTPKPADPQQYGDIVEAISDYVKNIMEACTDVASLLTSDGAQKMDELTSFVNGLMSTTSKKAKDYIESHSKQIEEQKELDRQKREAKLQSDSIKSDKVKNFIKNSQNAMASSSKDLGNDIKLLEKIQTAYEKNINKQNGFDLENALEDGWEALKSKYLELFPQKESVENPYGNNLNEEDANTQQQNNTQSNNQQPQMTGISNGNSDSSKKLVIKANEIYNSLLLEFEKRFKEAFSTIDVKNLPKYEETKQQMQDLIDAADKSINNKIEQITKVQNGESSATGGLGQAAKVFLMGHPLESNNLREVWSRHLVDLKSRMTNRLTQMTDYKNKTRTLGWTWQVCRTVMPKILARMLTYRYIYAILSNEGFFSYDTETMKQDAQAFENDKDIYVNLAKTKLIWLLNQSVDYTANGEKLLIEDETNGGWRISNDNLAYAFFLASRLGGIKGNLGATMKTAEFLSNIKSYVKEEDQVNKLLIVIKNCMSSANQKLLNSPDPDKFNQLTDIFKMPDDIKNLKDEIKNTYDFLKQERAGIDTSNRDKLVNIAKTKDIVYLHPQDIYLAYMKNKGLVDEIIKNKINKGNIEEKDQKDIKNKLLDIFGDIISEEEIKDNNYNDVSAESITALFPADNAKDDYYSAILYVYPTGLKNNNVWDDKKGILVTMTPEAITQVCKVTKAMVPFMLSGILGYVIDVDNKDKDDAKNLEDLKTNLTDVINNYFASLYGIRQTLNKRNNNNVNAEIKNDYNKLHDLIKTQISKAYKDISSKSSYQINGIINNKGLTESMLLEIDNTSTNTQNVQNQSNWLDDIIDNANLYKNTSDPNKILENFKMALSDIKVIDKDGKIIQFTEIPEDKEKNQVLVDLCQSIIKVKDDGNILDLIKKIAKQLEITVFTTVNDIKKIQKFCKTLVDTADVILDLAGKHEDKDVEEAEKAIKTRYESVVDQILSQYTKISTDDKIKFNVAILKDYESNDFVKFNQALHTFNFDGADKNPLDGIFGKLSNIGIKMEDKGEFKALSNDEKESAIHNLALAIQVCENNQKFNELFKFIEYIKKLANS